MPLLPHFLLCMMAVLLLQPSSTVWLVFNAMNSFLRNAYKCPTSHLISQQDTSIDFNVRGEGGQSGLGGVD
jgi:hypothetical protein